MARHTYKLFWDLHKWTGIGGAVFLLVIAITGGLLLVKKDFAWIQPPTQIGAVGEVADFITIPELFGYVLAQEHPDFRSMDDIDRVDFRPSKRVFKVRSHHHSMEMQVDAVNGDVLSVESRLSDLLERIHDGSWFAGWMHGWVMPIVAIALVFLVVSGLYLWIDPLLRKRKKKARLREQTS